MWIVAKYKTKELETLKKVFFQTLGDMPEFYNPKIGYVWMNCMSFAGF